MRGGKVKYFHWGVIVTWCPFLEASILEDLVRGERLNSLTRESFKILFCCESEG